MSKRIQKQTKADRILKLQKAHACIAEAMDLIRSAVPESDYGRQRAELLAAFEIATESGSAWVKPSWLMYFSTIPSLLQRVIDWVPEDEAPSVAPAAAG